MIKCAFDNDHTVARLYELPANVLGAPETTPLEALRAVYGPHMEIVAYEYADGVDAFVLTCLSTHRGFLLHSDQWASVPGQDPIAVAQQRREALSVSLFRNYDQALSLLELAARFVEDGYTDRRDSGSLSKADDFVALLVALWFEQRVEAGDPWTIEPAVTLASLNNAGRVAPYIRDLGRQTGLSNAA